MLKECKKASVIVIGRYMEECNDLESFLKTNMKLYKRIIAIARKLKDIYSIRDVRCVGWRDGSTVKSVYGFYKVPDISS